MDDARLRELLEMHHVSAPRRVSFARYTQRRIGSGSDSEQVTNLLVRPFTASSFASFWRTFNPFYAYYLYYWAYKPLRRVMPRAAAELLTFAASGFFLHDIPLFVIQRGIGMPWVTIWFVLAGAIAIVGERLRMDLSRWPTSARACVNVAYIFGTLSLVAILSVTF